MFCSQCGAKNADDASFCQKCGKKLETSSQDDEPTLLTPPRSSSSPYGTLSPPRTTSGSIEPNFAAGSRVGAASERSDLSRQASPTVPPRQKSRQRRWIVLSLIAVVLFLLAVEESTDMPGPVEDRTRQPYLLWALHRAPPVCQRQPPPHPAAMIPDARQKGSKTE